MRRTQSISSRAALACAPLLLLLAACGRGAPATPTPGQVAPEIQAMLDRSAESWTQNDLDGFLDDYAEDATFVGSRGLLRGRSEIRAAYVRGYWSTGQAADGLRFEDVVVRPLGTDVAVATGRYQLYDRDTGRVTATGLFSLTLRQGEEGWRIVHDHSSADEPG